MADLPRCGEQGEVVVGDEGEQVDLVAEFGGKVAERVEGGHCCGWRLFWVTENWGGGIGNE